MGLDMYLTAKRFIWYDETEKKDELQKLVALFTLKGNKIFEDMKDYELKELTFEVGYWRKANQIHNWFVNNVQEGEDNCEEYSVSIEKLKELLEVINNILSEKDKKKRDELARELLPTQEGSFFGGTYYDFYYFQQLEKTKKIIKKLLKIKNFKDYSIYYNSSW